MTRCLAALGLLLVVLSGCVAGPGASSGFAVATGGSAGGTSGPTPSATWAPPSVPTTADGRPVLTVSQAAAEREAGRAGGTTFLVGGYWTVRSTTKSCPMPLETPAVIEDPCSSIVAGITEQYEAINNIVSGNQSTTTRGPNGPSLVPYIPPNLIDRLINGLMSPGPDAPPIPIVVAGHFDDPLAQQCRPEGRDACRARFALEDVLVFDPAAAPSATPEPSPTPFPSPAPSGLFEPARCNGDVPYSFVGWTTPAELGSDLQGDGHVWAVVTRDVVLLGNWYESPDTPAHFSRAWGGRVCTAELLIPSGMRLGVILGTAFREWDDGRRTRDDPFGPGSGDLAYPAAGPPPSPPPDVEVEMHGPARAPVQAAIRDWSGSLVSARPASDAELMAPGAETGEVHAAAARVLTNDPRSVLIVWAECGSDTSATMVITKDRQNVLIKGAPRNDCAQPGARRGAVITFSSPAPETIAATTGL